MNTSDQSDQFCNFHKSGSEFENSEFDDGDYYIVDYGDLYGNGNDNGN